MFSTTMEVNERENENQLIPTSAFGAVPDLSFSYMQLPLNQGQSFQPSVFFDLILFVFILLFCRHAQFMHGQNVRLPFAVLGWVTLPII